MADDATPPSPDTPAASDDPDDRVAFDEPAASTDAAEATGASEEAPTPSEDPQGWDDFDEHAASPGASDDSDGGTPVSAGGSARSVHGAGQSEAFAGAAAGSGPGGEVGVDPSEAQPGVVPPAPASDGPGAPARRPAPPRDSAASGWWPRRGSDRYLGGVASGIAQRIDVDAFVVRLALALAVTYLPVLAAGYALAWLVLPDGRTGRSLLDDASVAGRRGPALGVAALGAGALFLADDLGPGGDPGLTAGVVLLAVGYLLVTRQSDTLPPGPGDAPDPDPGDPDPVPDPGPAAGGRARWLPPPPPRWRASQPPRPPSHLGRFGLSVLLLLAGVLAVVDQAWTRVRPGVAVSIALLLLGGLLLVGARWGRARVLLPVGVLLLPLWLGLAASGVPRYQGDGAVDVVVGRDEPLPVAVRHGYGDLDVDLTAADLEPGSGHTLHVGLTAGRARIRVPREVHLEITGDIGIGEVAVLDRWQIGGSGPYVLQRIDRREGDPQETCQPVEEPVEPEVGPDGFPLEEDPMPDQPYPPVTIVHRDVETWEPCTPADPPDDPAVLELRLDVGIGTVEVHRV